MYFEKHVVDIRRDAVHGLLGIKFGKEDFSCPYQIVDIQPRVELSPSSDDDPCADSTLLQGPASSSPLMIGDIIEEVEGQQIGHLYPQDVSRLLSGRPGTTVRLTIRASSRFAAAPPLLGDEQRRAKESLPRHIVEHLRHKGDMPAAASGPGSRDWHTSSNDAARREARENEAWVDSSSSSLVPDSLEQEASAPRSMQHSSEVDVCLDTIKRQLAFLLMTSTILLHRSRLLLRATRAEIMVESRRLDACLLDCSRR